MAESENTEREPEHEVGEPVAVPDRVAPEWTETYGSWARDRIRPLPRRRTAAQPPWIQAAAAVGVAAVIAFLFFATLGVALGISSGLTLVAVGGLIIWMWMAQRSLRHRPDGPIGH